jgi:hypothetical protein
MKSMLPWFNLTPHEFEEFCYTLLECNGFKNLNWYGEGGSDKGRDIICTKTEAPLPGIESNATWLVQCKHYTKAKISKATLQEWLAACREHKPDRVLLIISKALSANLKDWIKSVATDYDFSIHIWEEVELHGQYHRHGSRLRKRFPQLPKIGKGKKVWLYQEAESQPQIWCNESDEVGLFILNDYGKKRNMEMVREFIEFIKANDFKFEGLRD